MIFFIIFCLIYHSSSVTHNRNVLHIRTVITRHQLKIDDKLGHQHIYGISFTKQTPMATTANHDGKAFDEPIDEDSYSDGESSDGEPADDFLIKHLRGLGFTDG